MQYVNKTMTFPMGGKDRDDYAKRWEETFGRKSPLPTEAQYEIPCTTVGCAAGAAVRTNWPGQGIKYFCPACAHRAQGVASALGFEPQTDIL